KTCHGTRPAAAPRASSNAPAARLAAVRAWLRATRKRSRASSLARGSARCRNEAWAAEGVSSTPPLPRELFLPSLPCSRAARAGPGERRRPSADGDLGQEGLQVYHRPAVAVGHRLLGRGLAQRSEEHTSELQS